MAGNDRITLNFGANTADVEQGTDRIASSLDDVDRKLEDVGNTGEQSGEQAAEGVSSVGDASEDAGGKLGDLGSLGKDVLEGDIGGAAQSAAGALASLGPAGAIAGTLAAAGIGLITTEIKNQEKEAQELRDKFAGMYQSAVEGGRDFLDSSQILKEALDIQWNPARADEYAKAQETAKDTGLALSTVLAGIAGDQSAANEVIAVSSQRVEDLAAKVAEFQGATQGGKNPLLEQLEGQKGALEDIRDRYQDVIDIQKDNTQKASESQQIISQLNANERADIAKNQAADEARYQGIADHLAQLNGQSVSIPVDFSIDKSAVEDYIADLKRRHIPIVADVIDGLTGKRLP